MGSNRSFIHDLPDRRTMHWPQCGVENSRLTQQALQFLLSQGPEHGRQGDFP